MINGVINSMQTIVNSISEATVKKDKKEVKVTVTVNNDKKKDSVNINKKTPKNITEPKSTQNVELSKKSNNQPLPGKTNSTASPENSMGVDPYGLPVDNMNQDPINNMIDTNTDFIVYSYKFKYIFSKLVSIKESLDNVCNQRLNNIKEQVNEAIEIFNKVIIPNMSKYIDKLDNLIDLYNKFIIAVLQKITEVFKEIEKEEESKPKPKPKPKDEDNTDKIKPEKKS